MTEYVMVNVINISKPNYKPIWFNANIEKGVTNIKDAQRFDHPMESLALYWASLTLPQAQDFIKKYAPNHVTD